MQKDMEKQYTCSYENGCLIQRLQQSGVIKNPLVINALLMLDRGNYTKVNFNIDNSFISL